MNRSLVWKSSLVLLLTAASCSKKDQAAPSGGSEPAAGSAAPATGGEPAPAAPTPGADPNQDLIDKYGSCEVTFEGDLQKTFRSPGGASALGSDYFMNEAETRVILSKFVGEAKVEEAMKKDPRLYTLIVNCSVDGLNLNFGAGIDSTYADIPFGPKKYEIGNKKGQISMLGSVENHKKFFRALPGSTFEITKFDGTGLAGTFEIAIEGDVKGKVRGKIDYRCAHDTSVCTAARGK